MFDIISQVSETLLISKLIFPLIAQTVWSQLKYGQIGYFFYSDISNLQLTPLVILSAIVIFNSRISIWLLL